MTAAEGAGGPGPGGRRDEMAVGLAYLFGTGALLVLLTLLLPHNGAADEGAIAAVAGAALVVAAALIAGGRGLPASVYAWTLALGAAMITLCLWWGGPSGRAYAALYVWVALYAFYFFDLRLALLLAVWSLVLHAIVLDARDVSPVPWVDGTMVFGTSLVAGTLIARLVGQVRGRAADLDAATSLANAMSAETDVSWARSKICDAAREACRADAAVLLEGGDRVTVAGDDALGAALAERPEVAVAVEAGESAVLARATTGPLEAHVEGLCHPVLLDGRPIGALAVGWRAPRRLIGDRAADAVSLFAAEATVALEREQRLSGERERRALEINDTIVQGLVVAKYALESGRDGEGSDAVARTLDRARQLMDRQLDLGRPGGPEPGDLRRETPGTVGPGLDDARVE